MTERSRILLKATLVITAALIINLAVTWACAMWSPFRSRTALPVHDGPGYPAVWAGGPHWEQGWWTKESGFGFAQHTAHSARGAEGDFTYWRGGTIPYREAGWPMLSFRSTVRAYQDPQTYERPRKWHLPFSVVLKRGIQTDDLPAFLKPMGARRLPLVPIWQGLVVNSLFYSLLILTALKLGRILTKKCTVPSKAAPCAPSLVR
jgi:hypothetical protein